MEITAIPYESAKKQLRRRFGTVGWTLLVYYGIMNAAVFLAAVWEILVRLIIGLAAGDPWDTGLVNVLESGWGYLLAIAIGLTILLLWKKPRYFREEIFARGKPMTPGNFFALACFFFSGQLVFQLAAIALELLLNVFGLSMLEGLSTMSAGTDNFSMFLYVCILGPITEEILFRGLIQRTLLPYGKKFAVFCSAFAFGIFHGNLLQSPYAFLVGLVLGYTAAEYSVLWSAVLHMLNNLVLADMLPRLTAGMPESVGTLLTWAVILAFSAGALVLLIVKRKEIREILSREKMNGFCLRCFFSSPGVIVLTALMGLSMALSFVLMLTTL